MARYIHTQGRDSPFHNKNGSLIITKNQQKISTSKPLPNQSFAAAAAARKAKAASMFKNQFGDSSSSESLDEDESASETDEQDDEDDEGFVPGPVQRFARKNGNNKKSQQQQQKKRLIQKKTSVSNGNRRTGPAKNLQKSSVSSSPLYAKKNGVTKSSTTAPVVKLNLTKKPNSNSNATTTTTVKNQNNKANDKKRRISDDEDDIFLDESPKKKVKKVLFRNEPEFMPVSSSLYNDEDSVTLSDEEESVTTGSDYSEADIDEDEDDDVDVDDEDADSVIAEEEEYMVEAAADTTNADEIDIMKILEGAYGFSSPEWDPEKAFADFNAAQDASGLKAPLNTPITTEPPRLSSAERRRASNASNSSAGDEEFPWMDRDDSALKYVINTHGYFDDELDEVDLDDDVFYSSDNEDSEDGSSCEDSESTTDDDATDLDETPVVSARARQHESGSISKGTAVAANKTPQKSPGQSTGPKLGTFVCDPNRMVAFVGNKGETVLLHPRWLSESSDGGMMTSSRTESEGDYSTVPSRRQSSATGDLEFLDAAFTPVAFSSRSISNTLVPSMLFSSPCHHLGEEIFSSSEEFDFEDEASELEDEHEKLIDKFLELSSSEDESDDAIDQDEDATPKARDINTTPRRPSTASSNNATPQDAMLSRWDQISVTAFRRRQIEHQQRLRDGKQQSYGGGLKSGRINRANFNMTPTRKKKRTSSGNNTTGAFKVPMKPRSISTTPIRRQSYHL